MLHDTVTKIKPITPSLSSTYEELKRQNTTPNTQFIMAMFDRLACRYDLFNHLTSMGMAAIWRKKTLQALAPGMSVLDLGCGTGDLTLGAVRRVGATGSVTGIDFSRNMLEMAARRYEKIKNINTAPAHFVAMRAEELPLKSEAFDAVVSGFVLRNIYENIDVILKGVRGSLIDGGMIRFLDITEPSSGIIRNLWSFYMQSATAFYGRILFGKDYPVSYLVDSAKRFLKPGAFTEKLSEHGFKEIEKRSFLFGIITLYSARK